MTGKFKRLIKDWALNTTFHGIPNAERSKYIFWKIAWVSIFLAALSYSAFVIVFHFIEFYTYGSYTTIQLFDTSQINFPAITICNINPFSTLDAVDFVSKGINSNVTSSLQNDYFNVATGLSYIKKAELLSKDINDTFRMLMGLSLESFVIRCFYNGKKCDLEKDFEWNYFSDFGNCFTFASAKSPKTVSKIGQDNGLLISLFVGLPRSIYTLDFFTGANVFVHSPDDKPVRDQAIQIASGLANSIGVSKVDYQRLGKPYNDCINKETIIKNILKNQTLYIATLAYNGNYSQAICLEYCYQYYILNKCSCIDINIRPVEDLISSKICSNAKELTCLYEGFVEFYDYSIERTKCTLMCPEECETVYFEMHHSSTQYSTNFLDSLAQNPKIVPLMEMFYNVTNLEQDLTRQSITTVSVFFNKPTYEYYLEVSQMTISDLLSKIGGVLGLLLGGSLISILEIFVLFIDLILNVIFSSSRSSESA